MNILSLFDGISCAKLALDKIGIPINRYYSSEIDKYAIKVAQSNYPDTIQLGDVTKLNSNNLPKIDLLIGGSPCQGFSVCGKHKISMIQGVSYSLNLLDCWKRQSHYTFY
jgi:site-specific DNA-cytosine methylase